MENNHRYVEVFAGYEPEVLSSVSKITRQIKYHSDTFEDVEWALYTSV